MRLEDIGFYTLSDQRAAECTLTGHPLQRCELILTPRCNFKCPYCRGVALAGDIDYPEAERTLRLWGELGLRNIRFSGGEPTLYKRLPDLVRLARELGCEHIAVSTNGSAKPSVYDSLVDAGVNDFSVSLDACCSASGEKMCGVPGMWERVIANIAHVAKRVYVTVGIVVTDDNIREVEATIKMADGLGVQDIRVIPAAQYSRNLKLDIPDEVLARHPILRYRSQNFKTGEPVRGIPDGGCRKCWLVADDMAVMGGNHYPCIIYMRERGSPIGPVGQYMMSRRREWMNSHDCLNDPICKANCLDVCVAYNAKVQSHADNT